MVQNVNGLLAVSRSVSIPFLEHSLCCILFNSYTLLYGIHFVTCISFSELICSSSNSKRHITVDETFVQVQQEHGKHTPHGP